ncbi:CesT family type III secretion system chaperone [Achromobacter marplatensis]|uniref:CesT family type III secretion system chaperone n=1 Tax=Achromobacter marplatensis TaxID=470868 RepID=UPI0039F69C05
MQEHKYVALLQQFCSDLGVQDAQKMLAEGQFQADGVDFAFVHDDMTTPNYMMIFTDFGDFPRHATASILADLLRTNLYFYAGAGSPTFSLAPDTGRVVLMSTESLDELTAGKLALSVKFLAQQATEWRERAAQTAPDTQMQTHLYERG